MLLGDGESVHNAAAPARFGSPSVIDPMTPSGSPDLRNADNTIELAELAGLGTRRLENIEVAGQTIESVRYPFPPPRRPA